MGACHRLAASANAQLGVDLTIVPLYRVDGEVELFGDLAIREASGDEAQDLHLAVV